MLIYGKNTLKEQNPKSIRRAYIARRDVLDYLKNNYIKYEYVDNKQLDSMVKGNHQGIVLEVDDYKYGDIKEINTNFILILDHIEDPHNLGAIIRSAVCAGVSQIIIPKDRAAKITDTVIKVSAGTISKVKIIIVTNIVNAINYLKENDYYIYASDMNGTDYKQVSYDEKKALIIGNEGKGISRLVKENADEIISITMKNNTDSLNASVAAGILLFEMRE